MEKEMAKEGVFKACLPRARSMNAIELNKWFRIKQEEDAVPEWRTAHLKVFIDSADEVV